MLGYRACAIRKCIYCFYYTDYELIIFYNFWLPLLSVSKAWQRRQICHIFASRTMRMLRMDNIHAPSSSWNTLTLFCVCIYMANGTINKQTNKKQHKANNQSFTTLWISVTRISLSLSVEESVHLVSMSLHPDWKYVGFEMIWNVLNFFCSLLSRCHFGWLILEVGSLKVHFHVYFWPMLSVHPIPNHCHMHSNCAPFWHPLK